MRGAGFRGADMCWRCCKKGRREEERRDGSYECGGGQVARARARVSARVQGRRQKAPAPLEPGVRRGQPGPGAARGWFMFDTITDGVECKSRRRIRVDACSTTPSSASCSRSTRSASPLPARSLAPPTRLYPPRPCPTQESRLLPVSVQHCRTSSTTRPSVLCARPRAPPSMSTTPATLHRRSSTRACHLILRTHIPLKRPSLSFSSCYDESSAQHEIFDQDVEPLVQLAFSGIVRIQLPYHAFGLISL